MKTFKELKDGDKFYLWTPEDKSNLVEVVVTDIKVTQYGNHKIKFRPSYKSEDYIITDGNASSYTGTMHHLLGATSREAFVKAFKENFAEDIKNLEHKIAYHEKEIAGLKENINWINELFRTN